MNHDPADLDGDGEFDAIDVVILEEGKNPRQPPNKSTGCCWVIMVIGAGFAGIAFTIIKFIT